jgi:hypothetical protein
VLRLAARSAAVAVLLAAVMAAPAAATVIRTWSGEQVPPGHRLSAARALDIARATPAARAAAKRWGGALEARTGTYGEHRWQVEFRVRGDMEAEVHVDDGTGRVVESWSGDKAQWRPGRGSTALHDEGETGTLTNAAWVWVVLAVLFVLPFVDTRRPFRALHADLAALLALTVSHAFLAHGRIGWSVAFAWPLMAWLAVRFALLALREPRRAGEGPLVPRAPAWCLAAGIVLLLLLRAAANIADSRPSDIAYAGAGGADRIEHGLELYTRGGLHYDTYGPVNYLLYVPFERVLPLDGNADADVWAAHAASIAFDLLTAAGLLLLGMRLRRGPPGTLLGLALAYAWTAFPYSWYALSLNTNDSAVPMLLLAAVLALGVPVLGGALVGLAAMTKFSPAIAAGAMFRYVLDRGGAARAALFTGAAAVVALAAIVIYLPDGGVRELWDVTIGFQLGRDSPFSPWGQQDWLDPLGVAFKVALVLLFAASVAQRGPVDRVRVCAWIAALLVTLQLGLSYWTDSYVVWFAPFALVAIFAMYSTSALVSGANGPTAPQHRTP